MELKLLQTHFARMGADLTVTERKDPPRRGRSRITQPAETRYVLNVIEGKKEHFTLDIWPSSIDSLQFSTTDIRPDWQHLMLIVKRFDQQQQQISKDKFLCGHDERHWFIAALPDKNGIATVNDAMEALKPDMVKQAQTRKRVRRKNWNKRRNAGFVRQGEWFFVPRPDFKATDQEAILRWEPITRGFGKSHMIEQVYRLGGQVVYVSWKHPQGLSENSYQQLIQRDPSAKKLSWRIMRRNPQVFARGKVSHPDHKTIHLPYWHEVAMASERGTASGGRPATVAFLD